MDTREFGYVRCMDLSGIVSSGRGRLGRLREAEGLGTREDLEGPGTDIWGMLDFEVGGNRRVGYLLGI